MVKLAKDVWLRSEERIIHGWEMSDEYGWRYIELWEVDGKLELRATDQDGGEVNPNI